MPDNGTLKRNNTINLMIHVLCQYVLFKSWKKIYKDVLLSPILDLTKTKKKMLSIMLF